MPIRQFQQNHQNPQNKRKRLINFIVVILAILIVFTACHKKKKPFLLLPLIDNSSVATTNGGSGDGGSGSGVGSSGDGGSGGSGVGSSGDGGSGGSGGPTFTPAQDILDDSFGAPNGYILQPVSTGSNSDIEYSLAIDKNGKILLGGYCRDTTISKYAFCIARFKPDGSLDNTFGTSGSGYIIQPICTSHDTGYSLKIQPDDNILLGGYCDNGSNNDFCVARFNSNGSLDTSFGTGGYKTISITSGDDYAYSLAILPIGNILLGGTCNNGSNYDFCIARFK